MEKIILVNLPDKSGVCHYVTKWRTKSLCRGAKVWMSPMAGEAKSFDYDTQKVIMEHVRSSMEGAKCVAIPRSALDGKLVDFRFWVVCDESGKVPVYYKGLDGGNAVWTKDVCEAEIDMSETSVDGSVERLRAQVGLGGRIAKVAIWLEKANPLVQPCMMIVCATKTEPQVVKYYAGEKKGRVKLAESSFAATYMNYDTALSKYEHLKMNYKEYSYAVLPRFRHNVKYRDMASYVERNKVVLRVVTAFFLKRHDE